MYVQYLRMCWYVRTYMCNFTCTHMRTYLCTYVFLKSNNIVIVYVRMYMRMSVAVSFNLSYSLSQIYRYFHCEVYSVNL